MATKKPVAKKTATTKTVAAKTTTKKRMFEKAATPAAAKRKPADKTKVADKAAPKKAPAKKPVTKAPAKAKLTVKGKTPKEIANEKGEPYVNILSVELDPDNIGNGAFELDWNDKFIANLVRAGYQTKPGEDESIIVDRWFQTICRNILAENYEQWQANQPSGGRVSVKEDLGGGKTGVS